jgi:hypothetical protein
MPWAFEELLSQTGASLAEGGCPLVALRGRVVADLIGRA